MPWGRDHADRPRGTRATAYGVPVTIDPGLPVALAVVLLLALTVTMYLVGRLPAPGSTLFAAARAIVQLSIAALVIAAVIRSLLLSLLLLGPRPMNCFYRATRLDSLSWASFFVANLPLIGTSYGPVTMYQPPSSRWKIMRTLIASLSARP